MKHLAIVTMQLKTPGGIERFVTTLANLLADHFEITIVANYGRPSDPIAFPLDPRVKLHFLTPNQPAEVSMKSLLAHPAKWLTIPAELRRRHQIAATQHQVFHNFFHNFSTDFIITDRTLYNILITQHYSGPALKIATDHNFHQNSQKYITKLLDSIKTFEYLIVATDELRDFYASRTTVKCLTIANPLSSIPTQKSPLATNNLLSVGRLVPEKDFSLLISAMSLVHEKNPSLHLIIIGDGSERTNLKTQIHSLGLDKAITLTGWLPQSTINNYYLDSSLYVSTSRTEAFGLTIAEAMSYGLPCLALSRASGARAQITKDTGILLDTPTPDAIAAAILDYFDHPDFRKSLQQNPTKLTKSKYSPSAIKEKWLKILR